jgi:AraC-like DNA-binding protein
MSPFRQSPPLLGLLLWQQDGIGRAVLEAIAAMPELRTRWRTLVEAPTQAGLRRLRRAGVRAMIGDFARVGAGGLPSVGVTYASRGVPRVLCDDYAMGRSAAAIAIERGLTRGLAISWHGGHLLRRCEGFRDGLRAAGGDAEIRVTRNFTVMTRLLRTLPQPSIAFCCNDAMAIVQLRRLTAAAVIIPHQLSVIGADGVDPHPALAHPALTTIPFDAAAIAKAAFALLDRQINGAIPASTTILVPPGPPLLRDSTPGTIWPPLAWLRATSLPPTTVNAWAIGCQMPTRLLSQDCPGQTGLTAKQALDRERLERATRLLRTTALPQAVIAARCGITSPTRLGLLCRRLNGCTPGSLRGR